MARTRIAEVVSPVHAGIPYTSQWVWLRYDNVVDQHPGIRQAIYIPSQPRKGLNGPREHGAVDLVGTGREYRRVGSAA